MSVTLHPAAERDLESAFRYYRERASDRTALKLLAEFQRVADLLGENPDFGTRLGGGRRMFPLRTFPYAVIYKPIADGIRILVFRHQHRDPDFGKRRA